MAPTNKRAIYPFDKAPSLQVVEAPYPTAGPDELIVRVRAIGLNPIDWKIQDQGTDVIPSLTYPKSGGEDISGVVVAVGPGVTRFKPGDRVAGYPPWANGDRAAAFQHYAVMKQDIAFPLPDALSFEDGAVVPVGVSTAAHMLYVYLGLDYSGLTLDPDTSEKKNKKKKGEMILIAGGASVIGSSAIQQAVACGYDVWATSSAHNFEHCKHLGASRVFDYHAPSIAAEIKAALTESGTTCTSALAVSEDSIALAFDILSSQRDIVSSSTDDKEKQLKVACAIPFDTATIPEGVTAEFASTRNIFEPELTEVLYEKYLPRGLASGTYKCLPGPRIVGKGLEALQGAFDEGKKGGISCCKLVVTLEE